MSGDYSDGEGSVKPDADFVDATADTEVEVRLPLEVDLEQDQSREDVRTYSGAALIRAPELGQTEMAQTRAAVAYPYGAP